MGGISHALALAEAGEFDEALEVLMKELERSGAPESEMVCEWIALCYARLGEPGRAAEWYEAAAMLVLSSDSPPLSRRGADALYFLESALECHTRAGNGSARSRLLPVTERVRQTCPSR
jgi:tetratricopeptide (TPR) repeat protein